MEIVVATYNVHGCVGRDGRFDPARIATVLRELDADVVALQELQWNPQDDALNILNSLARELNYDAIPGPTLLRHEGHYGNAILTRLKVSSVRAIDLSVPGRELRGALDVVLVNGGSDVRIIATHLGLFPGERRKQMRQLLALLAHSPVDPVVLMGDLNEWFQWGRPVRWLRKYFGYTPALPTYPSVFPVFALDRIWTTPPQRLSGLTVFVSAASRAASDHLPLRATIKP